MASTIGVMVAECGVPRVEEAKGAILEAVTDAPEGMERFAGSAEAYAPRRIWSRRQTFNV